MKIFCPREALRKFRAECRAMYPREHLAALFGQRSTEGNILITRMSPIEYKSDKDSIDYKNHDVRRSKMAALRKQEDWIGTIHSHCNIPGDTCCWHLSSDDIRSALQFGESICAVVYVTEKGKRTSVHWYVPSPIPEVFYDEKSLYRAAGKSRF